MIHGDKMSAVDAHSAHAHEHEDGHTHGQHHSIKEHLHEHEHIHEPMPCDGEGHEHHHHPDGSCCCHHHDVEYHGMPLAMKLRIALSAALFVVCMVIPTSETLEAALMIAAAVIAGYDIVIEAVKGLFSREIFNEYFLMSVAAIASCIIGEYEECAAVMVMYRIGEACQNYAISGSRRKLDYYVGFYGHEAMDDGKQRLITRFSRIYTPVVLVLAVMAAVLLPLFGSVGWEDSVNRALNFLVLACPCAIVISIPMVYFAGIGAASKRGIYFHDSHVVDSLAREKTAEGAFKSMTLAGGTCLVYGDMRSGSAAIIGSDSSADGKTAWRIARKTRAIAFENIWFVIVIKLTVLVLSTFGVVPLWFAVFADSGVTVVTVLNSLRAFGTK